MKTFLGRKKELELLNTYDKSAKSNLIVIKGRRRIGKSRLVREFAKDKTLYRFVGLAPDKAITAQHQRNEFARKLREYFPSLPELKALDWAELFELLATHSAKQHAILFFDEVSWMAHDDPTFLPKLKNAWDEAFSQNHKLMLILCSSISYWIEKNILASTSFIGRINHTISLRELSLKHASELMTQGKKHLSAFDQFKYLSIVGGVPYYLENYHPSDPLEKNVARLCYSDGGLLLKEFDRIFHDLFGKRSTVYKKIVETLVKKSQNRADIAKATKLPENGIISDYLRDLLEAGFISRDYAWDLNSKQFSSLSTYRLSDNYLRFYLRYLDKLKPQIERGHFNQQSLSSLPEWSTIMGLQFENLVLNHRELIWPHLPINPNDIVIDGAFFQNTTKRQAGCQIDYLIQTRFNNLFICEIKFQRDAINTSIIKEVETKINRISKPNNVSCFPVLIHVNGITDALIDSNYFSAIIDFSTLIAD
jgi:uncharacterized protein